MLFNRDIAFLNEHALEIRMAAKTVGPRSSLFSHSFPSFYACYLLKSVQTPNSKATYIGSTPSPPRRIRQHNGEITQGAWKTRDKRPWVMQMIVYGFPSRLAALQFEWAWQHPYMSRHLRDTEGKQIVASSSKSIKKHIENVRLMISNHPFNIWPLHVKLFTEEASKAWSESALNTSRNPPPPGFTCSIELEGVDGNSGHPGSGRKGPIHVKDEHFTSAFLAKNTALLASGRQLRCFICNGLMHDYATSPLTMVLCPAPSCTATSHLLCLSQEFLKFETANKGMIPRGGSCRTCGKYTLWGDIVRGCYRRAAGGAPGESQEDNEELDDLFESDTGEEDISIPSKTPKKLSKSKSNAAIPTKRKKRSTPSMPDCSEGELFDLNGISLGSNSNVATPVKRIGRSRKIDAASLPSSSKQPVVCKPDATIRTKRKKRSTPSNADTSEGELFDFSGIPSESDSNEPMPVKILGRPRKIGATSEPGPSKQSARKPAAAILIKRKKRTTSSKPDSSEGEVFDFDGISAGSDSGEPTPVKRRGRPRKIDAAPEPGPSKQPAQKSLKTILPTKRKKPANISNHDTSSGESFDFNVGLSNEDVNLTPKKKAGRPKKAITSPSISPRKSKARAASPATKRKLHTMVTSFADPIDVDSISSEKGSPATLISRHERVDTAVGRPPMTTLSRVKRLFSPSRTTVPRGTGTDDMVHSELLDDPIISDDFEDELSRYLSGLSVSSLDDFPMQVIEISD